MASCCQKCCPEEQQTELQIEIKKKKTHSESQSNNQGLNNHQNSQQHSIDNYCSKPSLKLEQSPIKQLKGDQDSFICNLIPNVTFQTPIQLDGDLDKDNRQNSEYNSLNGYSKQPEFIKYHSFINQKQEMEIPKGQLSQKFTLFLSKQPGKDYLIEPNSYYEGYFDVEKQVKYKYGKIIIKQYDSHFNQSFFTYEGPFQNNKCKGPNGKQFYGKSDLIQFQGEWDSQGRNELTGIFYDGGGRLIPNPNPKPKNKKIKIIAITDIKTGQSSQLQQQQIKSSPKSWCAYDQLYYQRDLEILQGNAWLNSSIIDGYITYLNYTDQKVYWETNNRAKYNRTLIFASNVFSNFHENQKDNNKYNFRKEFYEFQPIQYRFWRIFKQIAIVINQNNSHWYFVILDFQSKKMIIQDSLQGMKNHYKIVQKILEELFSDEEVVIKFDLYIDKECLQQNNGYDCGTYVCLNAKRLLLKNQPDIQIDQNITDPKKMRKELYDFIQKFRDQK